MRSRVRLFVTVALLLSLLSVFPLPAGAAAPEIKFPVTFTTTLTPGTTYTCTLSIWTARIGGTQVGSWSETLVKLPVASDRTVYYVLGTKKALPALDFTQQYWVQLQTGTAKFRTRLPAAGYAFWSNGVNTAPLDARYVEEGQTGAVTSPMIADGQVTAAKVWSEAAGAGTVLTADGAGGASWQTATSASGGDITGVTAGTGLTGGGDNGAVMLGLTVPVAVANGGTGSTTKNFVDLATAQTVAGVKTFSNQIASTVATGIAPLAVSSSTAVANLNADLLDGNHAAAFATSGHAHDTTYWKTGGNGGTTPGTNFIGTTDNQRLDFKVNNARALRLEPNATSPSVVAGYTGNSLTAGVAGAFIAGGSGQSVCGPSGSLPCLNSVQADFGTVGGGLGNHARAYAATVAGGTGNDTTAGGAAIGGGGNNTASGGSSTIAGGKKNTASGDSSTVGGGHDNEASGLNSTVPGGMWNKAGGLLSLAAGNRAVVRDAAATQDSDGDEGAFVWADRSVDADFTTTGPNQFLIRAAGGVGISTNTPAPNSLSFGDGMGQRINFWGNVYGIGMQVGAMYNRVDAGGGGGGFAWYRGGTHANSTFDAGGGTTLMTLDRSGNLATLGTVNGSSDRNLKEEFTAVEPAEVLAKVAALPISSWKYKADEHGIRHIGPMAQDFREAFGLGVDERHIATVDADGVALAAIQGLNAIVAWQRARIDAQDAAGKDLADRLKAQDDRLAAQADELAALKTQLAAQGLLIERLLASAGKGGENTAAR